MSGEGKGPRSALVLAATLVVCLLAPAVASATTRYAAPGGTATAAQCTTPASPCTINEAATGTGVVAADEVVVAPGDYSDTAGDLGTDEVHPIAGKIHGVLGLPRPVITLNASHGFGAVDVSAGITVSYLTIQSAVSDRAIAVGGGTVDGVIARGTGSFGAACQHVSGIIRNSACISTASGGTAVGVSVGTSGSEVATLRNVTAIATGPGSAAASYRVVGTGSIMLSAKGVIARGVATDVRASASGGGSTTITIDHSNFATTDTSLGGGTITDGGSNQSSAPMLASDNVHQLSGSPTINAGAVDGSSGTTDVDGQARSIGGAPDIGADELGHPTSIQVSCTPNPTLVGAGTTCTATVFDTATSGGGVPQGTLDFSSDTTGGAFDPGPSCTLVMAGENGSTCHVTYTPGTVGTGTHQISASFPGDTIREASNGLTNVVVTKHPSATSIACAPNSITLGSGTSTCVVTVTDTSTAISTPTGSVALSSGSGTFGSGCGSLVFVSMSQSNCTVTYTPTVPGMNLLTGQYGGDPAHETSGGTALVDVSAPPTAVPTPTPGTKKKCKKRKHRAAAAKRCKRKKR